MIRLPFLQDLRERSSMRLAVVGNGLGDVAVPGRPNYMYARLGSATGQVAEVHRSVINPNEGDYIYISNANPFAVNAQWRLAFWLRDGGDPTLPAPMA